MLLLLLPRQPHPNTHNKMAAQKSYTMNPFHNCSSDASISTDRVTKKMSPPDKSFSATRPYLMPIIMWFLFSISFYNKNTHQNCVTGHLKVPEDSFYTFADSKHYMFFHVFWSSSANPVPEMSANIQFPSFAVLQNSHVNDVNKKMLPGDHFCSSSGCGNDVD